MSPRDALHELRRTGKPRVDLLPDLDGLLVTAPEQYQLTTAAVDEMLDVFGKLRTALKPQVPLDWPPHTLAEAIRDVSVCVEFDAFNGDAILRIRHPGLGWLHFGFSRDTMRAVGALLLAKADAPSPAPAGSA